MKINFIRSIFPVIAAGILSGCGSTSPSIVSTPVENIDEIPLKIVELNETQLENWSSYDLVADTIPGMSVNRAYTEIIRKNKPSTVIVAVLDSGVDIEHEDLRSNIWKNPKETAGNGKDDDKNGYIDDVNGWNFLGDAVKENMEYTRMVSRLQSKYEGKTESSISAGDREEFRMYQAAKAEYDKEYSETQQNLTRYKELKGQFQAAHDAMTKALGKEDYTSDELAKYEATTQEMQQYKAMLQQIQSQVDESIPEALKQLDEGIEYYQNRLDTHFNMNLNGRAKTGDDPYDITDTNYGNNKVMGPDPEKEDIKHGTHVAGIIAATRDNGKGINGIANNVKIMSIRAVPDGDEYDKDIALGIRYAVDNGAKVINTSFGKYFSPNPEWVIDAIKYAAQKDVLIVNAAGNESLDLDVKRVYPNDQNPNQTQEISDNFLTVGSLNYEYGSGLVSDFSNYGKTNVDVFAPGTKIWSTTPNNTYEFLQGTSMAAPAVTGIAAIIRGYYPKLSAGQVKKIIMDSGISTKAAVLVGEGGSTKKFKELSTSGNMANLYNALIMADQVSKN